MSNSTGAAKADLRAIREACLLVRAHSAGFEVLADTVAEAAKNAGGDTTVEELSNEIGRQVLVRLVSEARRIAPPDIHVSFVRKDI